MKRMVVKGTDIGSRIHVDRFRLDPVSLQAPACFEISIFTEDKIFEYDFSVTDERVVEEKLTRVLKTTERVLFHRKNGRIKFHKSLKQQQHLSFAFKGTRDNQLFLTNAVSQNVTHFKAIYDWFRHRLELISPDARFQPFEQLLDESHLLHTDMNELLPQLDTGIESLGNEEIPLEKAMLPKPIKDDLYAFLNERSGEVGLKVDVDRPGERFLLLRDGDKAIIRKPVTYRRMWDGTTARFDIAEESDGTQRIIDLLPAVINLADGMQGKVYVIDELDRSLHSLLTQKLLTLYLQNCSTDTRSQLLFTTHDISLMDQRLFRRDEMWVTERASNGCTELFSFSDYQHIRHDKDIRKSYLEGRLGGIPRFMLTNIQFRENRNENGESS